MFMRTVVYEQLSQIEDHLWWHQARADLVRRLLRKMQVADAAIALDVGCGTGGARTWLRQAAKTVIGVDRSQHALSLARRKHPDGQFILADANDLQSIFRVHSVDLICLFNVMYHDWITDDRGVLRQARRILRPGGVVLITEAAFPCLTRRHDRLAMGARRYRLQDIRECLQDVGFQWFSGSYFNSLAFLPALFFALQDRRQSGRSETDSTIPAELQLPPRPVDRALRLWMRFEAGLISLFGGLPFGTSLACAARNPTTAEEFVALPSESFRSEMAANTSSAVATR